MARLEVRYKTKGGRNTCPRDWWRAKYGLTELEKEVVAIIGTTAITGIPQILDPLNMECYKTEAIKIIIPEEVSLEAAATQGSTMEAADENSEVEIIIPTEEPRRRAHKRKINDDSVDEQMAAAMELQAASTAEITKQLARITDVGCQLIEMWSQRNSDPEENRD